MSSAATTPEPAPLARTAPYGRTLIDKVLHGWGARAGLAWVGLMAFSAVFAPFLADTHPLLVQEAGRWHSPMLHYLAVGDVLLLIAAALALAFLPWRRFRLADRVLAAAVPLGFAMLAGHWPDDISPFLTGSPGAYGSVFVGWFVSLAIGLGLLIYLALLIWAAVHLLRSPTARPALRVASMLVSAALCVWLVSWPIRPPQTVVYEDVRAGIAAGKFSFCLRAPLPFSPDDRLRDQPEKRLSPPDSVHPMGVTLSGADLLSNMIYATRIAMSIGFIATGIEIVIGIIIGGLMGYYSGVVDLIGMRLVEIFSAIPTLTLLLCFVAFFGANLYIMMVIIGLTGWVGNAVFIRAEFLRLREQDFVQAAVAQGLPLRSVLFKHMLPNGVAPVLVGASFDVAGAILAESTLSFLGIGLVNEASWGRLLNDALGSGGTFFWWLALYPGLAIFLTVFAYNLVGEAMRDAIDPHMQRSSQLQ